MPVTFMSRPTEVWQAYLAERKPLGERKAFKAGQLAVGMEILTQVKILRELPFTEQTTAVCVALETLLMDCGLYDDAERWYDRLDAWRAPRFEAAVVRGDDVVRGASSVVATPEGAVARIKRLRALPWERRGLGEVSTSSSSEPPDEAA